MATEDDLAQNAADLALADAALAAPEAELIGDSAAAPAAAEAGAEAQAPEQPQHEQAPAAGVLRDLLDERDKR